MELSVLSIVLICSFVFMPLYYTIPCKYYRTIHTRAYNGLSFKMYIITVFFLVKIRDLQVGMFMF